MNGYLMSKDTPIAELQADRLTPLREELLPFYLRRGGDFSYWLEKRAIDQHRTNSRLLKRVLRLKEYDDLSTVLKVHAATITDCYWVKTDQEPDLTYDRVRFSQNYFAELALKGDIRSLQRSYTPEQLQRGTPELTNVGSFEKCWRLENGEWWLYKSGSAAELFSEYVIDRFGALLHYPMAEYQLDGGTIKGRDFTGGTLNFEPAFSLVGENQDYLHNYDVFRALNPRLAGQYVNMLALDTVVLNFDRHTENYGILRDQNSGAILSMAPNFDNNIALISRGIPANRENDLFFEEFSELLSQRKLPFRLPPLDGEDVTRIVSEAADLTGIDPAAQDATVQLLMNRYRRLQRLALPEPKRTKSDRNLSLN